MLLEVSCNGSLTYQPGDHVGVYPCNRAEIVDGLLRRLKGADSTLDWGDNLVQLQLLNEKHTPNGNIVETDCVESHCVNNIQDC